MSESRPPQRGTWIILDGATPTAFRARDRETLLPTLVQLKRTQPGVKLMWFERGRVWESPLEARAALVARRQQRRPPGRTAEWRPGGDHRNRQYRSPLSRDQKRARFKSRQRSGPPKPRGPKGSK